MPSSVYHLLERAFGGGFSSPFGLHPRDRERTQEYFSAAWNAGMTCAEVEADIREYLDAKKATPEEAAKQLDRARELYRR